MVIYSVLLVAIAFTVAILVYGYIKRLPSQGMQMFSNSDSYYIKFPNNASPLDKLLIIFTTIFIDFQYFEGSGISIRIK